MPIIPKNRFDGANKFGMGKIFLKRNDFVFYPRRNLKIVITYEYTFEKWDKDLAGKTPNDIKEMFDCNNKLEINALYSSEIVSIRIISEPFFPFIRFHKGTTGYLVNKLFTNISYTITVYTIF